MASLNPYVEHHFAKSSVWSVMVYKLKNSFLKFIRSRKNAVQTLHPLTSLLVYKINQENWGKGAGKAFLWVLWNTETYSRRNLKILKCNAIKRINLGHIRHARFSPMFLLERCLHTPLTAVIKTAFHKRRKLSNSVTKRTN